MKLSIILIGTFGCMIALLGCGGSDTPDSSGNLIMDGNNSAGTHSDTSVENALGVSLTQILSPISEESPAGSDLRLSPIYQAIKEARREDDPSLPLGAWEHELKRANWNATSKLALEALLDDSKDLQLAAWLLEAQIHLRGFKALKPSLMIIGSLSEVYWNEMYPRDQEQRDDIFRWIVDKMRLPLRMLPITADITTGGSSPRAYSWADREQAIRNEQIKEAKGKPGAQDIEGVTLEAFNAAVYSTPDNFYQELLGDITDARSELNELSSVLDRLCGDDAPSFGALDDLLENVVLLASKELKRRREALG